MSSMFSVSTPVLVSKIVYGRPGLKREVADYLRQTIPQCRLRRILGDAVDTTMLLQAPVSDNIRESVNEMVLKLDGAPGPVQSTSLIGQVIFNNPHASDDRMVGWVFAEVNDRAAIRVASGGTVNSNLPKGTEILEVIHLLNISTELLFVVGFDSIADALGVREGLTLSLASYGKLKEFLY